MTPGFIVAPAEASASVTIHTISAKVVSHGAAVTVRPNVVVKRSVSVRSKRITVKQGSRYVARSTTSARLVAGTYAVTTTVHYRIKSKGRYGSLRSLTRSQTLKVTTDPATIPVSTPTTPVTPPPSAPAPAGLRTVGKPCDTTSLTKAGGGAWQCTFSDEFDGTTLDRTKWIPQQTATSGYYNGGECYVDDPDNIAVADGALRLTARKEAQSSTCASPHGAYSTQYTSGMVSTWDRFAQTYGRFEIRAAFASDSRPGLHGALWLWPQDPSKYGSWPDSGEIDIAEMYSQYSDRVIPYVHYASAPQDTTVTNNYCMVEDVTKFHTYVLEWTPSTISIAYDGKTCLEHTISPLDKTAGSAPFDQPYIVALTQALGQGSNAFTELSGGSATTRVDYVRVWK
jgi:beta-glucanase (GH16 family)